jgi:hypothetical protein
MELVNSSNGFDLSERIDEENENTRENIDQKQRNPTSLKPQSNRNVPKFSSFNIR